MINSMTMTTSMQLAEGCLKQDDEDPINDFPQNTTYEGLELFAQALETVLARVKVRFVDTTIRVEYIPQGSMTGIGLEIHIKK
jgi:autophagy-related protein 2